MRNLRRVGVHQGEDEKRRPREQREIEKIEVKVLSHYE